VCSDDEMDWESEKVLEKHDVDDWAEGMKEKGKKGREKGKRKRKDAEGDRRDTYERGPLRKSDVLSWTMRGPSNALTRLRISIQSQLALNF
jgi:hypothetical protein